MKGSMWGQPPSAVRRAKGGESALRQAVSDELGNTPCGRRVHVGEHSDHVAGTRADLQRTIHSGRTAAVAEASRAVDLVIFKSIGVTVIGRPGLSGGRQFRVVF